jgi:phage shock protein E
MARKIMSALLLVLLALGSAGAQGGTPRLSPAIGEKALIALLADKGAKALLLDVRTAEEFGAGHIPGALLFPYDELEAKFKDPDKGRPIVVYCRSGRRSAIAKTTLERMGYRNVSDFGGYGNWTGRLDK